MEDTVSIKPQTTFHGENAQKDVHDAREKVTLSPLTSTSDFQ